MKYVIEHLEKEMYPWCIIEYEHLSKKVGKDKIIFTNVKKPDKKKIEKFGKVEERSVVELKLKNACLLDPKSDKTFSPKDTFDYLIFGGILGDYPRRGRTDELLTKKMKGIVTRNLGKKQMSTDTAVYVAKLISDGKKLEELPFKDKPSIMLKVGKYNEEIHLPYRYLVENGEVLVSKKLLKYLKEKEDL